MLLLLLLLLLIFIIIIPFNFFLDARKICKLWKYNESVPENVLYGDEGGDNNNETEKTEPEPVSVSLHNDEEYNSESESDDDDDDVDNNTEVFTKFYNYLRSRCGENKTAKQAKQHVHQTTVVLNDNIFSADINKLTMSEKAEKWLNVAIEGNKSVSTLASYCYSVSKFILFIHEHYKTIDLEAGLHTIWKKLAASCRSEAFIQQLHAEDKNYKEALTLDDMKGISTGLEAYYDNCLLKIYNTLGGSNKISDGEAWKFRAYFILQLARTNALRPSELINLQTENVLDAYKQDDMHVIKVVRHKNTQSHGSAHIAINDVIYQQLVRYINDILPLCVGYGNTDALFFTSSQTELSNSVLSKTVDRISKKDLKINNKVNLTKIRSCVSSNMLENYPEQVANTAAAMNHSEATARRYYHNGVVKKRQKIKLVKSFEKVVNDAVCDNTKTETITDSDCGDCATTSETGRNNKGVINTRTQRVTVHTTKTTKRERFSPEQEAHIKDLFKDHIRRRVTPIFAEIREICQHTDKLSNKTVQQLRDKVKNLVKKK